MADDRLLLTGSCLCGAVAYEAQGEPEAIVHCHCATCRKAHGAAFSSIAAVRRAGFRWVRGADALSVFESSPGKFRSFCRTCGSQIVAERADSAHVMLRLGCLDTPITPRTQMHIWRSDGAAWCDPDVRWLQWPEAAPRP